MTTNAPPMLEARHLVKQFNDGTHRINVLRDTNLTIHKAEIVALVGPSGCGKSTLLQLLGLLDAPTQGIITINGVDCSNQGERLRTRLREESIGFVYQFHHLLEEFTARENVAIPLLMRGLSRRNALTQADECLDRLGLGSRTTHRPSALSGGEKQRVSIARALVKQPALLLADEPTGNLDPTTSQQVFSLLLENARRTGAATLIVTHNTALANSLDRVLTLHEGLIYDITKPRV